MFVAQCRKSGNLCMPVVGARLSALDRGIRGVAGLVGFSGGFKAMIGAGGMDDQEKSAMRDCSASAGEI